MSPLRIIAYAEIEKLPEEKLVTLLTIIDDLPDAPQIYKTDPLFEMLRKDVDKRPQLTIEEINEEIRLARIDMSKRPPGESLLDQIRKNSSNSSWLTMDEIDEEIRLAREEPCQREDASKAIG